jgi:predicted ATPase
MLHFGRKVTDELNLHFDFEPNAYRCTLVPTSEDTLVFGDETMFYRSSEEYDSPWDQRLGSGHKETKLHEESQRFSYTAIADHILHSINSWQVYHFHDTSEQAKVKSAGEVDDNRYLRPDAGNLAAFLYLLRETQRDAYRNIVDAIKMVAPFFDDFNLHPDRLNTRKIRLEWQERGSDAYFGAHALSDGTLRFISLATLLLQPELPTTILLDEPELGLHPYAIAVLADLLSSAATRTQIIVSTQSVTLIDHLSLEDLVVVDREGGESTFRRLSKKELSSWLDEYTLGDLWEKNVFGGRPSP